MAGAARSEIEATRYISETPDRVFAFLSDLRNHWRLESAFVELGALEGEGDRPTGGRVRISGPLGLSREAATTVLSAEQPGPGSPGKLDGRAELGETTVGRVRWEITAASDGGATVTLSATVERASFLDRMLLALGGRRWLQGVFERALATLAAVFSKDGGR